MSAYALVTGTLFRSPERRTSKNGKPFTTATLKAKDGEAMQFWKIVAFAENAQTELLRLGDGDAVSVQGPMRVETYERDGETKLSLSLIADHVLALRQPPKSRGEKPSDDAIPY